jgi:hypothetical protein
MFIEMIDFLFSFQFCDVAQAIIFSRFDDIQNIKLENPKHSLIL